MSAARTFNFIDHSGTKPSRQLCLWQTIQCYAMDRNAAKQNVCTSCALTDLAFEVTLKRVSVGSGTSARSETPATPSTGIHNPAHFIADARGSITKLHAPQEADALFTVQRTVRWQTKLFSKQEVRRIWNAVHCADAAHG